MRLGELKTLTRDFDGRQVIKLSCYNEEKGITIYNLEFDIINDNEIYFRLGDKDER